MFKNMNNTNTEKDQDRLNRVQKNKEADFNREAIKNEQRMHNAYNKGGLTAMINEEKKLYKENKENL